LAARAPGTGVLWFVGIVGFVAALVLAALMIITNKRLKKDRD